MHTHREGIQRLGDILAEYDAQHQTITFVRDHAALVKKTTSETVGKQRRPSMVERSVDLLWLSSKVDKFRAQVWWAGSFVIVMRIAQTSTLVFIVNPGLQATVASLIALVGVAIQTHTAPYRRASDNHAALAAAWLLFVWSFVLLVRYSGAVGGEQGVILGALLIVATLVVVAFVACAVVVDVKQHTLIVERRDLTQATATPTTVSTDEDTSTSANALANAPAAEEVPVPHGTDGIVGVDIVDVKTAAHDGEEEKYPHWLSFSCSL
jgi:hypothetical protein